MGGPFFLYKTLPFTWSPRVLCGMSKSLATALILAPLSTAAMAACIWTSVHWPTFRFEVVLSDLQVGTRWGTWAESSGSCALWRGGLCLPKCTCRFAGPSSCGEVHGAVLGIVWKAPYRRTGYAWTRIRFLYCRRLRRSALTPVAVPALLHPLYTSPPRSPLSRIPSSAPSPSSAPLAYAGPDVLSA